MKRARRAISVLMIVLGSLLGSVEAHGEKRAMDVERSVLKIHVYKAGFFSAFGHNHEVVAPIAEGAVEQSANPGVELRVDARKLRVVDPELSPNKRAEVQKTMDGPQVLDSSRFPEIRFGSTAVEKAGANHWIVRGNLTLHGEMRPVTVDVTEKDGRYQGSATLRQRDFGIQPISLAGGTVKVKDEVKIEFEIVLAK